MKFQRLRTSVKKFTGKITKLASKIRRRLPADLRFYLRLGALTLLAGSAIYLITQARLSEASWWDDTWHYRKSIVVSAGSSGASDFQVEIADYNTSTEISAGKMKQDCGDIRFTTEDGILLDFWVVEDTCNTSTTDIWVKMDVPSSGSVTIYMYYGNLSAESASNGDKTFTFFDDFNDGSIDESKWVTVDGAPVEVYDEMSLYMTGAGFEIVRSYNAMSFSNTVLTIKSRNMATTIQHRFGATNEVTGNNFHGAIGVSPDSMVIQRVNTGYVYTDSANDGATTQVQRVAVDTNYHIYKFVHKTSSIDFYEDSTLWNHATNIPNENMYVWLQWEWATANASRDDYVYLRDWMTTMPSAGTPSSEESSTAPIAYWDFDEGYGTTAYNSQEALNNKALGGWWKFDEGSGTILHDELELNDGTLSGPDWTTTGHIGGALDFNGTSDYVNVGDVTTFDGATSMTISAWINFDTSATDEAYVRKWAAGAQAYILGFSGNYADEFRMVINDSTGSNVLAVESSAANLSSGNWYHLVGVWRGGNWIDLYMNGVKQATTTVYDASPSSIPNVTEELCIGCRMNTGGSPDNFFDGEIDNIKIWGRALTDSEVIAEYNERSAHLLPQASTFYTEDTNGHIYGEDSTYSTARSTSTGYQSTLIVNTGQRFSSPNYTLYRSYFEFDTSSIPDSSTVLDARLNLSVVIDNSDTDFNVEIYKYNWSSPITSGNQEANYDASGATFDQNWQNTSSISTGIYYENSTSLDTSWVSKTGMTRYQLKSSRDTTSTSPTGDEYVRFWGVYSHEESPFLAVTTDSPKQTWGEGAQPNSNQNPMGKSADMDGYDDYAVVQDHPSLDIEDGKDMSISVWVNRQKETIGTMDDQVILAKRNGDSSSDTGYLLQFSSNNYVFFEVSDGTDEYSLRGNTTDVEDDLWHHIVVVFDESSSTNSTVYIDGKKESSITKTGTIGNVGSLANSLQLAIGSESDGDNSCHGNIDEMKIFDHALSHDEILVEYNRGFSAVLGVGDDGDTGDGPIGYWPLDEGVGNTAFDRSGYNRHGILGTGSSKPIWTYGMYGKALDFDGTGDSVNLNNQMPDPTSFTVEAWINGTYAATTYHHIFSDADDMAISVYDGKLAGYIDANGYTWWTPNIPLSNNTWYHVAYTHDGTTQKLYVDGVEKGSDATGGSWSYSSTNGQWISDPVYEFNGIIDDVRYYDYARTEGQIKMDMNAGHPLGGSPTPSPDAYWKFDEGYGDTSYDSSVHANNGNLEGTCPGSATCPSWSNDGISQKALYFDGGDSIQVTDDDALDQSGDFSISVWAKADSSCTDTTSEIISKKVLSSSLSDNYNNYSLRMNCYTGKHVIFIVGSGSSSSTLTTDNNTITLDDWYHIVAVIDAENDHQKVYINGKLSKQQTFPLIPYENAGPVVIGRHQNSSNAYQYFYGTIDEPKIYSAALTDEQVRTEYNLGKSVVMGAAGTESTGDPSYSADRSYCVPGDSTSCVSPVGEWKLDEKTGTAAYDTSPNNNVGTLTGMESTDWLGGGDCHSGNCLVFDGSNEYINCGTSTSLRFSTGAFSLSGWVYISTSTGSKQIVASDNLTNGYGILTVATTNTLRFVTRGTTDDYTDTTGAIPLDTWTHVAAVFTGSNGQRRLYINGKLDTAESFTGSATTASSAFYIGQRADGGNDYNGRLDQIRVYNYALSNEQIAWDYNRGKPTAHWKFDEGSGTTAYDSAKNGLDGGLESMESGDWVDGFSNKALDFDGTTSELVRIDDNALLSFGDSVQDLPFSFSAWINMDDATDAQVAFKAAEWDIGTGSSDTLEVYLYDGNYLKLTSNSALTSLQGQWAHLMVTYDGSSSQAGITAYINGQEIPSTKTASGTYVAMHDYTADTLIGYSYDGKIDDVRLYSYELTQEQVRDVYNLGSAVHW